MEFIQLFAALRPAFAAAVGMGALLVCSAAYALNGGFGPFTRPGPPLVIAAGLLLLAFFSIGALRNLRIRTWVLHPDASMPHVRLGLQFFGAAGALFAAAFGATAWTLR